MLLAGILFDIGVVLTAGALNIYMLMAGRVLLGVAVAFASVSVTLYNSEMAPAQLRGRLNQLFQVTHPSETLMHIPFVSLLVESVEVPAGSMLSGVAAALASVSFTRRGRRHVARSMCRAMWKQRHMRC